MISVIIPAYNAEPYICTIIDSLLSQTYNCFEIIAVDDGSTDNTFAVLQTYQAKDKRIKAVSQSNKGPSAARNKGISMAEGDFIVFVDADDDVPDNYLQVLRTAIENADMAICNRILRSCGNDDVVVKTSGIKYSLKEFLQTVLRGDVNPVVMFQTPTNRIFRKRLIDSNMLCFNERYKYGEDTLFNLDYLSVCSEVNTTTETSYIAYVNSGSLSHSQSPQRFDCYKEIRAVYALTLEKNRLLNKENQISFARYFTDNFLARAGEILNTSFDKEWKAKQLGYLIKSGIVTSEDIVVARGAALPWKLLSLAIKTGSGKLLFLWFVIAPKLGV